MPSRNPKVGSNCLIGTKDFGYFPCRAISLNYGFDINTEEVRARVTQTMYSHYRIESAFQVVTRHSSYGDFLALQKFFQKYARLWETGGSSVPSMMQVVLPFQKQPFFRYGIPQSPIPLGDTPRNVVWDMSLTFLSIDKTVLGKDVSSFHLPEHLTTYKGSAGAPFFYPSGIQLSGKQSEVDVIFDGGLTQKQIDDLYPVSPPPAPPPDKPKGGKVF